MKDRIKDYFTFTRKEQRGLIVLLGLMILSISANFFLPLFIPEKKYDMGPFKAEVEQFLAAAARADSIDEAVSKKFTSAREDVSRPILEPFLASPFHFDPNKLSEEDWANMGMDGMITRNILRYRAKGGKFRDAEGFSRLYGMNEEIFAILRPYLQFEENTKKTYPSKNEEKNASSKKWDNDKFKKYEAEKVLIEINSADSASLLALNGIGPSYAGRIVKYRERLGGFYRKEQLFEVIGMDSLRYSQFNDQVNIDTAFIKKIDLNTVTFKDLLKHPYFEYYLVKAIFNKKDEVKAFDSIGQIRHLTVMYEELYEKIAPYLEVKR